MALAFSPEIAGKIGDSPVIVTGAGGWLGQAALEMFAGAVPLSRLHAFGASARLHSLRNGESLPIHPLTALHEFSAREVLIFHLAFLTREHAGQMKLPDYTAANRTISAQVESYLRCNGARGLFVPSSGAAATADPVHNPYGALKLEDEWRFAALGRELCVPVVNMRVYNLAGPFINKLGSYALACILRDLLARRPVRLNASHPVWRGYAHVADVLAIALGLLLRENAPPVFDSWGESVELSHLAERAAAVLGVPLTIERPAQTGPANRYLGDESAYLAHAAALNLTPASLERQIRDTADYLGRCLAI